MSDRNNNHKGRREMQGRGLGNALREMRLNHKRRIAVMSRGQRIRYRLLQALVVLAIVAIVVCLAIRSWMRLPEVPTYPTGDSSQSSDGMSFDGAEIPNVARSGRKEGVYTFLVVGQDTGGGGNTDTMMLVTFDSANKKIYGMSLPRDTMVNVSTSSKRLNAVYNYNKGRDKDTQVANGMAALKKEVGKLTGIIPDYYVLVQWEAVGELVDALGGVYYEVPFDMDYDDPAQDLHIHQQAGYRLLNGDDAMQVIRHRKNNDGSHSGGDVARLKVQQSFLMAVAEKCLQPATLLKAPSLAKIFMDNVVTDLSLGNLLALAQLAYGMNAEEDVSFVTMPYTDAQYPGVSMILPVEDELLELLNNGFNPYQDNIQSSDLQILYRNSNGSYSVTSGTLADPSLAQPRSWSSSSGSGSGSGSSSEVVTDPDEGDDDVTGSGPDETEPGTGDTSGQIPGGDSQTQPGDGSGQGSGGEGQTPGTGDTSGQTPGGDSQTQPGEGSGQTTGGGEDQTGGGDTASQPGGGETQPSVIQPEGGSQGGETGTSESGPVIQVSPNPLLDAQDLPAA